MTEPDEIDVALLSKGLAIEADSPTAVIGCRWENDTFVVPDGVEFDEREREAVAYMLAVRMIRQAAERVVDASEAMIKAKAAVSEAQAQLNLASYDLGQALGRSEYLDGLPEVPLAIGNAVVVRDEDQGTPNRYRAIIGTWIGMMNRGCANGDARHEES